MIEMKTSSRSFRQIVQTGIGIMLAIAALVVLTSNVSTKGDEDGGFNRRGNILITDQFANRVVEVDRDHHVIWHFGDGAFVPGPHSIVGPNDAERVGEFTLISGTGTPAGADPSCPLGGGCPDNRVIAVNQEGEIVWQYGQNGGVAGSGPDQLNTPVQNTYLPNGHILITDQLNERIIEVTLHKDIVWQYGTTGVTGSGPNQLSNPNSAELLDNGNILIADENNNRAIEVTHTMPSTIVATFSAQGTANGVAFASRLPNGDTLLTDSNNNRIVEVEGGDNVVWQYFTNTRPGSYSSPLPTRAVRLRNRHTLISDQFNDQVIEINRHGVIVWSQGKIDTNNGPDAKGFNLLNAPYSAYVIGDYTGLTNPFPEDEGNPEGARKAPRF